MLLLLLLWLVLTCPTHLLEALHTHADACDTKRLVLQQPLQVKRAWVCLNGNLGICCNAKLLLQS
jgi:hypothetical protein